MGINAKRVQVMTAWFGVYGKEGQSQMNGCREIVYGRAQWYTCLELVCFGGLRFHISFLRFNFLLGLLEQPFLCLGLT